MPLCWLSGSRWLSTHGGTLPSLFSFCLDIFVHYLSFPASALALWLPLAELPWRGPFILCFRSFCLYICPFFWSRLAPQLARWLSLAELPGGEGGCLPPLFSLISDIFVHYFRPHVPLSWLSGFRSLSSYGWLGGEGIGEGGGASFCVFVYVWSICPLLCSSLLLGLALALWLSLLAELPGGGGFPSLFSFMFHILVHDFNWQLPLGLLAL